MATIRLWRTRLFEMTDIAPLVFFRVAFGALMLWEVWRYFEHNRITRYYVEPSYFFSFWGFDWVQPLPGDGMYILFYGLGLLSILIMLGAFYRVAMALFCLGFTYVFLLDMAQYLNHFYLVCLVSFLMIFIPAHRAWSVDALLNPAIRSQRAPNWALWLLRGQMAVVYIFAGLAKVNLDWLAGEPIREWLAARTDFPLIGHLFTQEWLVQIFTVGGLLLDLLIVPFLLFPRTRLFALVAAILFHLMNAGLFNIGIFPWFAIAATLMFLPAHWFRLGRPHPLPNAPFLMTPAAFQRWIVAGILGYFAIQVALPLRHLLYFGDPSWSEEGHTFAWRMRLRDKDGDIGFFAHDPRTGTAWRIPAEEYLSPRQFDQMKDNPPMIVQFAHDMAELERATSPDVRIYAYAMISLNSRAAQLLIDPSADLLQERNSLFKADWILPLVQQPSPQLATPALLISRRIEDALFLINIADTPFRLDGLTLQSDGHSLMPADFGVTSLAQGECLIMHAPEADILSIYVPCNQAADVIPLASELNDGALEVRNGESAIPCATPSCVIVDTP